MRYINVIISQENIQLIFRRFYGFKHRYPLSYVLFLLFISNHCNISNFVHSYADGSKLWFVPLSYASKLISSFQLSANLDLIFFLATSVLYFKISAFNVVFNFPLYSLHLRSPEGFVLDLRLLGLVSFIL